MTEVVLTEDIYNLGNVGDVVTVKPGFARNYLIPKGLALRTTKSNLEFFEAKKKELQEKAKQDKGNALKLAEKIDGKDFTYIAAASERGMLYGAVTPTIVAGILSEENIKVEKNAIQISKPIKQLGVHEIRIVLHADVSVNINLNIAQNESDAQEQLVEKNSQSTTTGNDDLDELNISA